MKLWSARKPVEAEEFETQQQKLRRLSGEVVRRHEKDMRAEINDPKRLEAVYGSAFASADSQRQAEVVALMAASMLKTPNCAVNLVLPDRQKTVASVMNNKIDTIDDQRLEDAWCKHVIGTGREFAVEDGSQHPLVCDTKQARDGSIVSYLGVPISSVDNIIVGVLCVFDDVERQWTSSDVSVLTQLSFVLTRALAGEPVTSR